MRWRPALSACAIALGLQASVIPSAAAFRTAKDSPDFRGQGKIAWNTDVAFSLSRSPLPDGVTDEQAVAALQQALSTWSEPECTRARPTFDGWVSEGASPHDGRNTIEWVTDWNKRDFAASAPGFADVQYVSTDEGFRIEEADIYLNAEDFAWSTSPTDAENDVAAVITHEIGHALGLLHPCEPDGSDGAPVCKNGPSAESEATMYPLYEPGQASLADDDVAGICYLYPIETDGCGGSCGFHETCVEKECRASCGDVLCAVGQVCGYWGCVPAGACTAQRCSSEACENDSACGPLGRCTNGSCSSGSTPWGDRCTASSDCEEGACVEGICQPPCQSDAQCGGNGSCVASLDGLARGCQSSGAYGFGMSCQLGEDCRTGLCVFTDDQTACTSKCTAADDCPSGWDCRVVDKRSVCVPGTITVDGGCSTAPRRPRAPGMPFFLSGVGFLTAVATFRRLRNTRRTRC